MGYNGAPVTPPPPGNSEEQPSRPEPSSSPEPSPSVSAEPALANRTHEPFSRYLIRTEGLPSGALMQSNGTIDSSLLSEVLSTCLLGRAAPGRVFVPDTDSRLGWAQRMAWDGGPGYAPYYLNVNLRAFHARPNAARSAWTLEGHLGADSDRDNRSEAVSSFGLKLDFDSNGSAGLMMTRDGIRRFVPVPIHATPAELADRVRLMDPAQQPTGFTWRDEFSLWRLSGFPSIEYQIENSNPAFYSEKRPGAASVHQNLHPVMSQVTMTLPSHTHSKGRGVSWLFSDPVSFSTPTLQMEDPRLNACLWAGISHEVPLLHDWGTDPSTQRDPLKSCAKISHPPLKEAALAWRHFLSEQKRSEDSKVLEKERALRGAVIEAITHSHASGRLDLKLVAETKRCLSDTYEYETLFEIAAQDIIRKALENLVGTDANSVLPSIKKHLNRDASGRLTKLPVFRLSLIGVDAAKSIYRHRNALGNRSRAILPFEEPAPFPEHGDELLPILPEPSLLDFDGGILAELAAVSVSELHVLLLHELIHSLQPDELHAENTAQSPEILNALFKPENRTLPIEKAQLSLSEENALARFATASWQRGLLAERDAWLKTHEVLHKGLLGKLGLPDVPWLKEEVQTITRKAGAPLSQDRTRWSQALLEHIDAQEGSSPAGLGGLFNNAHLIRALKEARTRLGLHPWGT